CAVTEVISRNARTSTPSAEAAHTNRYTGSARSSHSSVRENSGPDRLPSDARAIAITRAAASSSAGRYIRGTSQRGSAFGVRGSGFWFWLGRCGKTIGKCSRSGGSSAEAIERAVEREREDPEEGNAQPEEMQRRLIARTAQADRGADEEREEADCGKHEIERAAARSRGQRHLECLPCAEP